MRTAEEHGVDTHPVLLTGVHNDFHAVGMNAIFFDPDLVYSKQEGGVFSQSGELRNPGDRYGRHF